MIPVHGPTVRLENGHDIVITDAAASFQPDAEQVRDVLDSYTPLNPDTHYPLLEGLEAEQAIQALCDVAPLNGFAFRAGNCSADILDLFNGHGRYEKAEMLRISNLAARMLKRYMSFGSFTPESIGADRVERTVEIMGAGRRPIPTWRRIPPLPLERSKARH
jgi:hypothetical protein